VLKIEQTLSLLDDYLSQEVVPISPPSSWGWQALLEARVEGAEFVSTKKASPKNVDVTAPLGPKHRPGASRECVREGRRTNN